MSDADIRELERRWRETGSADDGAAWLRNRVRLGTLSERRLDHLARLGYAPAVFALADPGSPPSFGREPPAGELTGFRQALTETVVWCSEAQERGSADALRTPALAEEGWTANDVNDLWAEPESARRDAVRLLATRRALLLGASGWPEGAAASVLSEGRLLVFYPGNTLSDGAANGVTHGFFNDHNVPAWDTWVAGVSGSRCYEPGPLEFGVVCWIPADLVPLIHEGLEVNPERCIRWLEEVDGPFPSKLHAAGLLPEWQGPRSLGIEPQG